MSEPVTRSSFSRMIPLRRGLHFGRVAIALVWLFAMSAVAERPEEAYLKVYSIIDQAEALSEKGQTNQALAKFKEAQSALLELRREHPTWSSRAVGFRLNFLADKIASLSAKPAEPAANPTTVKPASETANTAPSQSLPAGMSVKLISAGAEPRQPLRIRVPSKASESGVMVAKSSMSMGAGGASDAMMKLPAMKINIGAVSLSSDDNGEIQYELRIEDTDVLVEGDTVAGAAEAMKASLGGMKGLIISCAMSDRGVNTSVVAKIPPGADAETRAGMEALRDSFADSEFVLPHEPVGLGARWEVKQKVKTDGMIVDQTTIHEVVSIQGNLLRLKSSASEQAANQKIRSPLAPQALVDLVKHTGKSTHTATLDLGRLLPVQITAGRDTETTVAISAGGQKQNVTIKSTGQYTVESKGK